MEENRNEVLGTLEEQKTEDVKTYDLDPITEDYDEDCNAGFGAGLLGGLGIAAAGYGIYRAVKFGKKKYEDWKARKKIEDAPVTEEDFVEAEVVSDEEESNAKKGKK